jgi:hypothetical protein
VINDCTTCLTYYLLGPLPFVELHKGALPTQCRVSDLLLGEEWMPTPHSEWSSPDFHIRIAHSRGRFELLPNKEARTALQELYWSCSYSYACERGLATSAPHNCLHSTATTQVASGGCPFDVQRQMGYINLTMMDSYATLKLTQLQQSHNPYSPMRTRVTEAEKESSPTGCWEREKKCVSPCAWSFL